MIQVRVKVNVKAKGVWVRKINTHPTHSVDATPLQKKQWLEEWKLNLSHSSHDKPTKKPFCGVQA
jgi:hypothetical protein